jgi:uncharacterized 2Fe-2S/4Fe-4S cluster protein (DUF4445 family)
MISYCIIDAETGEIVHGGMTYNEAIHFREKLFNSAAYVIQEEEGTN